MCVSCIILDEVLLFIIYLPVVLGLALWLSRTRARRHHLRFVCDGIYVDTRGSASVHTCVCVCVRECLRGWRG